MKPENSPIVKKANLDIVHFGLADLGRLLAQDPQQESGITRGQLRRSYDIAIHALRYGIDPGELALRAAVDMKTYRGTNGSSDPNTVVPAARGFEAGEELTYEPDRDILSPDRRINHRHLPDQEHYLPFVSTSELHLLVSADELATAHYNDAVEFFIPDLAAARQ